MKLPRWLTKKRLTLTEITVQREEDPDLEAEENFIPDHFQEEEMEADRREVSDMKGEEAEIEVAIGLLIIEATLVRGEVKAEEGSTKTDQKDLKTGMNMST